ncbi:MAG: alkaline phosphatase [Desulfobulbus sp.]|jgi:alkaline phosphatase
MLATNKKRFLPAAVLTGLLVCHAPAMADGSPKNLFLMISDGASFGTWDMGSLSQHGATASTSYFGADFSKYLMTTYALNTSKTPTGGHVAEVGYDPDQAWDSTPNTTTGFNAISYRNKNATDSAAAATAMATGTKTYNNAMNWDNDPAGTGSPITPTIAELSKQSGKTVGTISTVQWTHATPAGFSNAHNISRNDYVGIANAMLEGDTMDVIMGAGHPWYNNDNKPTTSAPNYNYVGGAETWDALYSGTHANGWTLVQHKAEFDDLADGDGLYKGQNLPDRVLGTAKVASTLQQSRSGYAANDPAYDDPMNTDVPDLTTMTMAAINVLDAKSKASGDKGFFLHVEGGAIDWAAHGNQTSRIIEEQVDFNNAVDAVISWIEANDGWENNLLVITTDHGNAMPMGADARSIFMDRIGLEDISGTPDITWFSGSHANELVPLFARGAGSELFADLVDGVDPYFGLYYQDWAETGFDGRYVDNTDIFTVMSAGMQSTSPVPEPNSLLLAVSGLLLWSAAGRRQRA